MTSDLNELNIPDIISQFTEKIDGVTGHNSGWIVFQINHIFENMMMMMYISELLVQIAQTTAAATTTTTTTRSNITIIEFYRILCYFEKSAFLSQ